MAASAQASALFRLSEGTGEANLTSQSAQRRGGLPCCTGNHHQNQLFRRLAAVKKALKVVRMDKGEEAKVCWSALDPQRHTHGGLIGNRHQLKPGAPGGLAGCRGSLGLLVPGHTQWPGSGIGDRHHALPQRI